MSAWSRRRTRRAGSTPPPSFGGTEGAGLSASSGGSHRTWTHPTGGVPCDTRSRWERARLAGPCGSTLRPAGTCSQDAKRPQAHTLYADRIATTWKRGLVHAPDPSKATAVCLGRCPCEPADDPVQGGPSMALDCRTASDRRNWGMPKRLSRRAAPGVVFRRRPAGRPRAGTFGCLHHAPSLCSFFQQRKR